MRIANRLPSGFLEGMRDCSDQNVLKTFSGKKLLKIANCKIEKEELPELISKI